MNRGYFKSLILNYFIIYIIIIDLPGVLIVFVFIDVLMKFANVGYIFVHINTT